MYTVLVTGSAGFIGFHVSKALLESGNQVIGWDNLNTYYSPVLKKARHAILSNFPKFVPVEKDLSDRAAIREYFEQYRPEKICHLAAQAGVRYSLKNPYAYQDSNLGGFVNLIEQSRLLPVERFVYASSSSVYGGNTKMPYSEDDPVNKPISLYAATKRANELIAYTYHHLWDLQTIALRFFTVYGPWGRPDMAYWTFFESILNDQPIKVFNYGKNKRDFTYIDEIVRGVIAALEVRDLDGYEIINLGNNQPIELMEFIHILEDLAKKKAIMEMVPPQPGDVVSTFADISRAQSKLNFSPKTDFRRGLASFVNWYLENPDLVNAVRDFRMHASER
jgi:UDP-glucuronate 4-epimerase